MTTIPDNEFYEHYTGDMMSADTMYHTYLKFYNKKKCIVCEKQWWQKKDSPILSDLCPVCRKKNLLRDNPNNL